jgi:hypothetical protein
MDLARQEGVFGYVGFPRIAIEGKQEKPRDADDDEEEGQIGRKLEDSRIAAQLQCRRCSRRRVSAGTKNARTEKLH